MNAEKRKRGNPGKLDLVRAEKIRRLRSEGSTLQELANQFGISVSQISRISANKSWQGR